MEPQVIIVLDPQCDEVKRWIERASEVLRLLNSAYQEFAERHIRKCEHCQEYWVRHIRDDE